MLSEPLSNVDAAWLHMEDPTNLMMVTGVLLFDEPIDFGRLRAVVAERLLRWPRFIQRVVEPRFSFGAPRWETDPHFDLRAHVHRVALAPPGGKAELEELVSDLMSAPLDFTKPLWQYHLIEGYGSGCALVCRLHHAIGDGIALVSVLLSMTDEAAGSAVQQKTFPAAVHGFGGLGAVLKSAADELLSGLLGAALHEGDQAGTSLDRRGASLGSLLKPAGEAVSKTLRKTGDLVHDGLQTLGHPERLLELYRKGVSGADALGKLLLMSPDPPSVFKGPLGVSKRAVWSEPFPLSGVKAIGKALGATVNDVLLTAVTGSLRRYLVRRGAPVWDLELRAVVPVNLRPLDAPPDLGNRFGLVFLPLPVKIEDPVDRLFELKDRMDEIKGSPEAIVAFGLLSVVGMAPADIEHLVVNLFGQRGTAVITNVPGPRQRFSMTGVPASGMMFWVPQSGRLGLGVSILSYAGNVSIGVATDVGLVPDPERLLETFNEELEALKTLVSETAPASAASGLPQRPASGPRRRTPRGRPPARAGRR
jgi:diacylglycerol O-acyltransferase